VTARVGILALVLAACLAAPVAAAAPAGATGPEQSKRAGQIAADAEKAMLGATNFHVRGYIDQRGGPLSLNLSMSPNGGGGTIQLPGATVQVVASAHEVFVKADEKSWLKLTGSKATAELLANRWAEGAATDPNFTNLAALTNSKSFLAGLTSGPAKLSKLPVIAIWGGHEALILQDNRGDRLYVVDGTTPYMLHLQEGHGTASAYITFSDFGTAPMPFVPVKAIPFPAVKATA
jgi:hypothetical protein